MRLTKRILENMVRKALNEGPVTGKAMKTVILKRLNSIKATLEKVAVSDDMTKEDLMDSLAGADHAEKDKDGIMFTVFAPGDIGSGIDSGSKEEPSDPEKDELEKLKAARKKEKEEEIRRTEEELDLLVRRQGGKEEPSDPDKDELEKLRAARKKEREDLESGKTIEDRKAGWEIEGEKKLDSTGRKKLDRVTDPLDRLEFGGK
jgi:hypothetical protein